MVLVLVASLVVRLLVAAILGPGFDEAHYYSYSLRPALSYFDHPPFVAFLAGLFPNMTGTVSPLTIRIGAIILFTATGLLFYRLSRIWLPEKEALIAYCLFNFVPLFFFCAGTMILPDAGLAFFWVVTLLLLKRLIFDQARTGTWVLAGIMTGCSLLCKYHGALLGFSLALYLLVVRPNAFLTRGPYLYGLSAVITSLPVLVWNVGHGFVSFAFQGGRILGASLSFKHFLVAVGGQTLYLTPFIFVPLVYVMWQTFVRGLLRKEEEYRFLFFFGTIPVLVFNLISVTKPVLPHWTLPGYIILMIPLARFIEEQWEKRPRLKRASAFLVIGFFSLLALVSLHLHYGIFHLEKLVQKGWIPEKAFRADPTLDVIGWDEVNRYLTENGLCPEEWFLFTHKWFLSSQADLATEGRYTVMCFNMNNPHAFGIWDSRLDMRGKNGVFICSNRYAAKPAEKFGAYFESISGPDAVTVNRSGVPSKTLYFYRCKNLLRRYPVP